MFNYVQAPGIITFPSFHAIVPALMHWPLRGTWAFWPTLPVSVTMILPIISTGGHPLADIVARMILRAAHKVAGPLYRQAGSSRRPCGACDGNTRIRPAWA